LEAFLPEIRAAAWIALDTEADSLHAYPEKLCLIQISTSQDDFLLDPLASMDMAPLLEALQNHEIIFHGADYDLRLLRKTFGFLPAAIFDTMIAARMLGAREFGYGHLVAKNLGITLEKGPQKANWAKRPLTQRMEAYARNDTHYLKPLAEILRAQLIEKGRSAWHKQACAQLITDCSEPRTVDPETIWRVKGSHHLSPAGLSVLRELWHWREQEAISANKPPYFILNPETMVHLAAAAETARPAESLIPSKMTTRRRTEVAHAIARGLAERNPPTRLRPRTVRQTEAEKRRLHELERRRNRHATELGLDPTLIASRAMLVLLARNWDEFSAELLPWQKELLEK
jgi:ribonuclease D